MNRAVGQFVLLEGGFQIRAVIGVAVLIDDDLLILQLVDRELPERRVLFGKGLELGAGHKVVVSRAVGSAAVGGAALSVGIAELDVEAGVVCAGDLRRVGFKELDRPALAERTGEQAGLVADRAVDHLLIRRHFKIADLILRDVLVEGGHDGLPHQRRGIEVDDRADLLGIVEAAPDRGRVPGREAAEPAVAVAGGGTRLARAGHAGHLGGRAGAVLTGVLQHADHIPGGVGIHGGVGLLGVVENHAALAVHDLGIGSALAVDAAVREGGVGRGHLPHGQTVGQLAHAERGQGNVGEGSAVDLLGLHQPVEHEVLLGKGEALFRGHVRENLDRDGVQRLGDAVVDDHPAGVAAGLVLGPVPAVDLRIGGILIGRARGDDPHGKGRTVDRERLDGGARRQTALRGAVQGQVALLLPHAAGHGDDVAGLVIDDDNGGLHLLRGIRGRDVCRIGVDCVHLGLGLQVDGGIDDEAAGRDHLAGSLGAELQLGCKVPRHVADDLILKVGVIVGFLDVELILMLADRAEVVVAVLGILVDLTLKIAFGADEGLVGQDQALELQLLVADGVIVLVLDIALLVHLLKDGQRALFVVLRVDIRIVERGVVGDADDAGAFLGRELIELLAEVDVRGALDAVGALAQEDRIEIPFQDLFLGVMLFKIQGAIDLHQLAADRDLLVLAQVLDELLRDRGAAVSGAADEHIGRGRERSHPVHAVMLPEALILDGDGGVDQVGRDLVIGDPDSVLHGKELTQLLILAGLWVFCVDEGGLIQLLALQRVMRLRLDILIQILLRPVQQLIGRHAAADAQGSRDQHGCRDEKPDDVNDPSGDGPLVRIPDVFPFQTVAFVHIVSSQKQRRMVLTQGSV